MFVTGPGGGNPNSPLGITAGPDGNVWFTVFQAANIVRISPNGRQTRFPLPAPYAGPEFISPGPGGMLW